MKTNQYSLITGAANGLGKAFAYELGRRKHNLILIDLPNTSLKALCDELHHKHGITAIYLEYDLSAYDELKKLITYINENFQINVLINNVGRGGSKKMEQVDSQYINSIVQLNVMATSILTHGLLPNLICQKEAYVLNVSSIIAFNPVGYKTVYPASKSFVYAFSMGLAEELKNTSVSVSVVTPGPMETNPDVCERIKAQGAFAKIGLLSPGRVAEISISKLYRKKRLILLNGFNMINYLISKLLPTSVWLSPICKVIKRETEMPINQSPNKLGMTESEILA
ncbi:MAG: SDR family NAD(P)-dependent oxidoreductase [Bacteroidota bacterium]